MRSTALMIAIGVLLLCVGATSALAVTWPAEGDWITLQWGGSPYSDTLNDEHPDWVDVVGNTTYPAGYLFLDNLGTPANSDDILMFRMRLHSSGLGNNSVWQFALDTDLDGGVDWSLQLDNKTDNRVEFVIATSPGPPFAIPPGTNPTEYDGLNAFWSSADLATYRRWSAPADGSNFGGNADAFLDLAMPWNEFSTITGLSDPTFGIALTTSADHNNTNKDHPDDNETFGSPIPEPLTAISILVAVTGLAGYVRKRLIS